MKKQAVRVRKEVRHRIELLEEAVLDPLKVAAPRSLALGGYDGSRREGPDEHQGARKVASGPSLLFTHRKGDDKTLGHTSWIVQRLSRTRLDVEWSEWYAGARPPQADDP